MTVSGYLHVFRGSGLKCRYTNTHRSSCVFDYEVSKTKSHIFGVRIVHLAPNSGANLCISHIIAVAESIDTNRFTQHVLIYLFIICI